MPFCCGQCGWPTDADRVADQYLPRGELILPNNHGEDRLESYFWQRDCNLDWSYHRVFFDKQKLPGLAEDMQKFYHKTIVRRMQKNNKQVADVMVSLGKKNTAKIGDTHYFYDPFVKLKGTKGGFTLNFFRSASGKSQPPVPRRFPRMSVRPLSRSRILMRSAVHDLDRFLAAFTSTKQWVIKNLALVAPYTTRYCKRTNQPLTSNS